MTRDQGPWDAILAMVPETEQLEYLRQILQIRSASGEERDLARFVAQSMQGIGIETALRELIPGRPSVVSRIPGTGRGPSLMLLAHLDVPVPAPGWTCKPYAGIVRKGRIYGVGVRDMKAGLAAMAMTMRAIRSASVPLEGDLLFAAVPGHMEQGVGAKRLFDAGIGADLVLVGEPTGLHLLGAHLGWSVLELTVHGRATATVTAREGVNAVEQAAAVIRSLTGMRFRSANPRPYVRRLLPTTPCYLSVAGIQAGDPLYPNFVPGLCTLTVDVRFVPGKKPREILQEVRSRLDTLRRRHSDLRASVQLKYGFALAPVVTRPTDPLLRVLREALRWANSSEPALVGFLYTTDGGIFQHGGPSSTVVCGPGSAPLRAPDEWVSTDEYFRSTAVYTRTVLETCGRTREAWGATAPRPRRRPGARGRDLGSGLPRSPMAPSR